jgi:hypothetical protein
MQKGKPIALHFLPHTHHEHWNQIHCSLIINGITFARKSIDFCKSIHQAPEGQITEALGRNS